MVPSWCHVQKRAGSVVASHSLRIAGNTSTGAIR
jgi:hypothetical protein